jgi:tetratricopeptide (TPR) repeat protein
VTTRTSILVALLLFALALPARADDPESSLPEDPTARSHFMRGNRLYRASQLDDAVAAYQAGVAIEPAPVFDYNLGQCYRKLGRRADAIRHYERFLERGQPTGELRDLVIAFLRQLREELAREAPAQPPERSSPPGTSAPRALPVMSAAPPPNALPARSMPAEPRRAGWYSVHLGWGLIVGGVAAAGGALYLHERAAALSGAADPAIAEDDRLELRDAARARGIASTALRLAGAALIVAGATGLALHPGRHEPALTRSGASRARTSWRVDLSGRGVVLLGEF